MKSWYYLHPEYKEELANRVSNNKAFYQNKTVPTINGAELIQQGLAKDVIFKDGELLVKIDLLPLIVNEKWNLVSKCLDRTKETEFANKLYDLSVSGLNKTTEFEIPSLINIALLYLRAKDKERAKKLLTEFSTNSIKSLCNCAKLWYFLFDDSEKARVCLENAEQNTDYYLPAFKSVFFIICAEVWMNLFNNKSKAFHFLINSEKYVDNPVSWIVCGEGWKLIFGDNKKTLECFERGYNEIQNSYDQGYMLFAFAEKWSILFTDTNRSELFLEKAESYMHLPIDWLNLSNYWKNIFNDSLNIKRCLNEAYKLANNNKSCDSLIKVARAWKRYFNDESESRKCLDNAEKTADNFCMWINCALNWVKLNGDIGHTIKCLENAEKIARKPNEFILCADLWTEFSNNTDNAKRCRKKVVSLNMHNSN